MFKTWQARLPQELRQAGIRTMAEANVYIQQQFLPSFNRNMKVKARETGTCFVPCGEQDLDSIFCVQHAREVQNDNTVAVGSRRLQIGPSKWRFSFAKCRVKVCEHLDGTVSIRYGPHVLPLPRTVEHFGVAGGRRINFFPPRGRKILTPGATTHNNKSDRSLVTKSGHLTCYEQDKPSGENTGSTFNTAHRLPGQ